MGFYIEVPQPKGKAQQLADLHGAIRLLTPPEAFEDVPEGQALICVINNGPFEAAALCHNAEEYGDFSDPNDLRPRQWMLLEKAMAHKLAGYTG